MRFNEEWRLGKGNMNDYKKKNYFIYAILQSLPDDLSKYPSSSNLFIALYNIKNNKFKISIYLILIYKKLLYIHYF